MPVSDWAPPWKSINVALLHPTSNMHVSRATPLGTQHLLAWAPLSRNPTQDDREAVRPSQPRDSEREGRSGWHEEAVAVVEDERGRASTGRPRGFRARPGRRLNCAGYRRGGMNCAGPALAQLYLGGRGPAGYVFDADARLQAGARGGRRRGSAHPWRSTMLAEKWR